MKNRLHDAVSTLITLRLLAEAQPLSRMFEEDKRHYLAAIARQTGVEVFVETGTYLGKTTALLADICKEVVTIEIDTALHARAAEMFASQPGVDVLLGDSGTLLPGVINNLTKPALFWLDGHYSSGITGMGTKTSPIEEELRAIFRHPIQEHVIVIDDARLFRGRGGYPRLRTIERMVLADSPYKIALHADLIRIQRQDI